MRLFLVGWAEDCPELVDVAEELNKTHQIIYWSRSSTTFKFDHARFPSVIFHDYEDAVAARPPASIDISEFHPPNAKILDQLSDTESIVLTMMNKKYDWMSVNQRKHLYYQYVRYWFGVLKKFKPELIIFSFIPHTLYNFVIFRLAKIMGIKTIMFDVTLINDRLLLMNDYEKGSRRLIEEIQKNNLKSFSISDLSSDIQEYYKKLVDRQPSYLTKEIKKFSFLNIIILKISIVLKSLRDMTILDKICNYIRKTMNDNLEDEYRKLETTPNLQKRYVYVPLQYQPECTTSPMGGIFVDQILMLETLSAAVPDGWSIYVKEHPIQWLSRGKNFVGARYAGYYKAIAAIKNVFIVPLKTDNFSLLRNSQAVATVTGTTGWEAVLRQKPTLVFGSPWWQHGPGVFRVNDVESCQTAFNAIMSHNLAEQKQIINFLYSFDQASVAGFVESYGQNVSLLNPNQNKENILKALFLEINKLTC